MNEVKFTIDGFGEFSCDADELRSWKTTKQLARAETAPGDVTYAIERIFMGRDEEYAERLGGTVEDIEKLTAAAREACEAKNYSASSPASKSTETK